MLFMNESLDQDVWPGTWNFRKAVFREIDKSISK